MGLFGKKPKLPPVTEAEIFHQDAVKLQQRRAAELADPAFQARQQKYDEQQARWDQQDADDRERLYRLRGID